jgi:hypothetical protein
MISSEQRGTVLQESFAVETSGAKSWSCRPTGRDQLVDRHLACFDVTPQMEPLHRERLPETATLVFYCRDGPSAANVVVGRASLQDGPPTIR